MKKKLLLISCIIAFSLNLAACGDDAKSSSKDKESDSKSSVTIPDDNDEELEQTDDTELDSMDIDDIIDEKSDNKSIDANASITDVIHNVRENLVDKNNYTATMNMTLDINMSINGESTAITEVIVSDVKSTNAGTHTMSTMTMIEGTSNSVETEETYVNGDVTYKSVDGGRSWMALMSARDQSEAVTESLFKDDSFFDLAQMEVVDNNYVITVDLNILQSVDSDFSSEFFNIDDGIIIHGSLVIIVDSNYYPIKTEVKNMTFDTESLLKEVLGLDGSEGIEASIDMGISLSVEYDNWNAVSDEDVIVPDEVIAAVDNETGMDHDHDIMYDADPDYLIND